MACDNQRDCLGIARFIVEVLTLVVLLWYTIITNRLWKTADLGNKFNAENDYLDRHAWVGITEALPPPRSKSGVDAVYLNNGEQVEFEVFGVNSGKTPAKNVHQRITFITLPASAPFSPKYPIVPGNIGVIQPGAKLRWSTPTTEERGTELHILSYQSGRNVLYLFGK